MIERLGAPRAQEAGVDDILCPGDRVRAGALGRAALQLANETPLRLDEETTLIFPASKPGKSFLQLLEAGVRYIEAGTNKPEKVQLIESFAIGRYEVSFEDYDRFAKDTKRRLPDDRGWGRGGRPVINVTWDDAQTYAAWLSEKTGGRYRLPTEAEWEYAARGGTMTSYWWGNEVGRNHANCDGCGSQWDDRETAPVGSFAPNPFGLYDTAGNVWEWVEDCYHGNYQGAPADGSVWLENGGGDCKGRMVRGGSWVDIPQSLGSAIRDGSGIDEASHFLGFRLARSL